MMSPPVSNFPNVEKRSSIRPPFLFRSISCGFTAFWNLDMIHVKLKTTGSILD